jgi:hypothetical protein
LLAGCPTKFCLKHPGGRGRPSVTIVTTYLLAHARDPAIQVLPHQRLHVRRSKQWVGTQRRRNAPWT